MDWLIGKGVTINKTARKWSIRGIVFDDLALKYAEEYLVETQLIGVRFLISVVCDANAISAYGFDNKVDFHVNSLIAPTLLQVLLRKAPSHISRQSARH